MNTFLEDLPDFVLYRMNINNAPLGSVERSQLELLGTITLALVNINETLKTILATLAKEKSQ